MKKFTAALSAVFFSITICNSQTNNLPQSNAISFELGKTGLIYNVSFDHRFSAKNFGLRAVAGSNFSQYLTIVSFGGGAYYLVGKNKNFFELGLDVQFMIVDEVSDDQLDFASLFVYPNYSTKSIYPSLNLGYRLYGKKSLFRVGISPGLVDGDFVPGGYVSIGVRF